MITKCKLTHFNDMTKTSSFRNLTFYFLLFTFYFQLKKAPQRLFVIPGRLFASHWQAHSLLTSSSSRSVGTPRFERASPSRSRRRFTLSSYFLLFTFYFQLKKAPQRLSVIPGRLERPTNRTGICHSIH